MPFHPKKFEDAVVAVTGAPFPAALGEHCTAYAAAKTPLQKAQCVRDLMEALVTEVGADVGRAIMRCCACIGPGVINKALALKRDAPPLESEDGLDELLVRLNAVHIGGGHLRREGDVIRATYERCYCGSVSKTKAPLSATYCACSCGWYQRLFEALLDCPVVVELAGSIVQGHPACEFVIRPGMNG